MIEDLVKTIKIQPAYAANHSDDSERPMALKPGTSFKSESKSFRALKPPEEPQSVSPS